VLQYGKHATCPIQIGGNAYHRILQRKQQGFKARYQQGKHSKTPPQFLISHGKNRGKPLKDKYISDRG